VLAPSLLIAAALLAVPTAEEPASAPALFEGATRSYNLGEFDAALAGYRAAYKADPRPAFLFNIAQCHFGLKDYEQAIFFYEGYLREEADSPRREQVEGFIEDAKQRLDDAAAQEIERDEDARRSLLDDPAQQPATPVLPTAHLPPAPLTVVEPMTSTRVPAAEQEFDWLWPIVGGVTTAVAVATIAASSTAVWFFAGPLPQGTLETLDFSRSEGRPPPPPPPS